MGRLSIISFLLLMLPFVQRIAAGESTLEYGAFGKLSIYTLSDNPRNVVLFVSGDGGWNLGVVDMARSLATLDALVVGIDITHYLKVLEQSKQAALASWNFMSATGSAGGVATESPCSPRWTNSALCRCSAYTEATKRTTACVRNCRDMADAW